MGDARSSHGISVEDEPISDPQCYELAISSMKTGGVEVIVAGHILQASPV